MESRQNKPPKGGAASGHGGQKFHTDSEQAKLHKSKLRMESREERLNKARERLAKQKRPKKPGPIKRIARIAGHETHAFLHGKVYQEERDNVGVEGGHFVERSGEAAAPPSGGLFCLFSIGGVLRLGGQQVVDLATGETVTKRDGDAAIEQQALAGVGLRDIR